MSPATISFAANVRESLGKATSAFATFADLADQTKALVLLGAKGNVYAGTVPAHEKARRRAANKVARRSRRINRGR